MTNLNVHPANSGTAEALWDAYRRNDKAAVMDYLFRRSPIGIFRSRPFPRLMIPHKLEKRNTLSRAHREAVLINRVARQIPLRSALN